MQDGTNKTSTWADYKQFFAIWSENSTTFVTNIYQRWQLAIQKPDQKVAKYIAYFDRQASYLLDSLRPNKEIQK